MTRPVERKKSSHAAMAIRERKGKRYCPRMNYSWLADRLMRTSAVGANSDRAAPNGRCKLLAFSLTLEVATLSPGESSPEFGRRNSEYRANFARSRTMTGDKNN